MSQVRLVAASRETLSGAFHLARAVCGHESHGDDEAKLICAGSLTSEDVCHSQQEHGEAFGLNLPPSRP